jgi:hypothetical protein
MCGCKEALDVALNCVLNGQWGDLSGFGLFFLVFATGFLRLFAEILGWIAEKTKNKTANQAVHTTMDIVLKLAKIIGFFGVGTFSKSKKV